MELRHRQSIVENNAAKARIQSGLLMLKVNPCPESNERGG